jgi:hypothetical protein
VEISICISSFFFIIMKHLRQANLIMKTVYLTQSSGGAEHLALASARPHEHLALASTRLAWARPHGTVGKHVHKQSAIGEVGGQRGILGQAGTCVQVTLMRMHTNREGPLVTQGFPSGPNS